MKSELKVVVQNGLNPSRFGLEPKSRGLFVYFALDHLVPLMGRYNYCLLLFISISMGEQIPQIPSKNPSPALWIILAVVLAFIVVAFIYYGGFFNSNTNSNAGTNQIVNTANINIAANEKINTPTKTNIDTSDWLTYENEEYEFSFMYPSDWTLGVLEYNPSGIDALNRGGNGVVVGDPDSGELFMVCPDVRGQGCVVSHEPHEITLKTPTQVDGRSAVKLNYKIGEVLGCPECTRDLKTIKIVLDDIPSSWTQSEFLLVPSASGSLDTVEHILQTFELWHD